MDPIVKESDEPDDIALFHSKLVWSRETFAVAASKKSARYQDKPGFYVEPELSDEMFHFMREGFLIKPDEAKVLPFSEVDDATLGKRISRHPLHETYTKHTRQRPPK